MELVIKPEIPYVGPISRSFTPGKWLNICGTIPFGASRFTISLQCSAEIAMPGDVALQILVNIPDDNLSVNSMRTSIWDEAQTILGIPIKRGEKFEVAVTCDFTQYKISINGEQYCEFPQRISYERITHLAIAGDVSIEKIFSDSQASAPASTIPPLQYGFKQETEAPPPSYSEVQSKVYTPNAINYGACSLPQSMPGNSTYPTAAPFVPAVPGYQPYPVQPGVYPAQPGGYLSQSGTLVPLNAASSNFRPVSPSKRKKYTSWACAIFIVIILIGVAVFNSSERKHRNRHGHNHDWDY